MKERQTNALILVALAVAGILSLCIWVGASPSVTIIERNPGADRRPTAAQLEGGLGSIAGVLTRSTGVPSNLPGAWPGFRGPNLDNISPGGFQPAEEGQGFPECWAIDVGEGHAGAAVLDGRVYLHDYDREKAMDALRCLSLDDGQEIWRYAYPVKVKRNHGMSRTVPAVTGECVVALGPKCHVTCLDAKSGELRWAIELVREYGTTVPPWYAGQCPIIDEGRAILAPGGTALVIAVDCTTGEPLWQAPNENGWTMTHASLLPMEFGGKRFYVYCGSGGVAGVSAEDGRILWETTEWRIRMATVPTPVDVGGGRIFLSGGYQAGSMMLKLETEGDRIVTRSLFRLEPEQFGSAQQTPVFFEGHIYGVRPDGQLVCLDLEGNEKWASSSAYKFGLGPYAISGDLIYVMNNEGLLSRVEATADAFRMKDQTPVLEGHDSWGPLAFAGSRLILRDLKRMACLDVAKQ